MTPEVFARTIVSIEHNHGLRLDARSVWMRMDELKKVKDLADGKCNESRGWYGQKGSGGCKRGKRKTEETPGNSIIHVIPPLSKENIPTDAAIRKLQVAIIMRPHNPSSKENSAAEGLKVLTEALTLAERTKSEYENHKRLHQLIDGGKKSIDPSLMKEINKTPTKEQIANLDKAKKAYDKITETLKIKDSFKTKEWGELTKLETAMKGIEENRVKAMSEVRDQMLKISKRDAIKHAEKIEIAPSASRDSKILRAELAEVYRLIGPRDLHLEKIEKTTPRAYANPLKKYINSGSYNGKEDFRKTLFHEVGHFLEWEKSVVPVTKMWVEKRGNGPIAPIPGYSEKENAIPDHFMNAYVGKVYPNSTEVLSMGLQQFHSPRAMLDLYKADKEHFFLTVGLINNDKI